MTRRLLLPLLLVLLSPALHAAVEVSPPPIGLSLNAVAGSIASNGDGFLAVFQREYAETSSGLVALDRSGERVNEVAHFASSHGAFVTRLDDRYLMSWIDDNRRPRLSVVSATAEVLGDWNAPGIPPAPYRAPYELYSTRSGHRILLVDRQRGNAYLASSDGVLLKTFADLRTTAYVGGNDRFFRMRIAPGGVFVDSVPADGGAETPAFQIETPAAVARVLGTVIGNRLLLTWLEWQEVPQPSHGQEAYEAFVAVVTTSGIERDRTRLREIEPGAIALIGLTTADDEAVLIARTARVQSLTRLVELRLDDDGRTSNPRELGSSSGAAVASNGERIVVHATERQPAGALSVAISLERGSGVRRVQTSITRVAQEQPRVASDGVESLIVWREGTAGGDAIKARRFSTSNGPLGDTITIAENPGKFGDHAVAAGAGLYLVVWHHWQQLYAARVTMSGTVLDEEPILITAGLGRWASPIVASDGTNFLVVWGGRGVTVSAAGTVSSPRELLPPSEDAFPLLISDAVWNGTSYIFLLYRFQSTFPGSPVPMQFYLTRLSRELEPLTPRQLVARTVDARSGPSFGSGPDGTLVTFVDAVGALIGIHVDTELNPGAPFVIAERATSAGEPRYANGDFVIGSSPFRQAYHLLRIRPGSTTVRTLIAHAPPGTSRIDRTVFVAVSTDGVAALINAEVRGTGSEAPTSRIIAYLEHQDFTLPWRLRAVRR